MDILEKSIEAIAATVNIDGSIQLTPVWFYWDGSAVYFSTTKSRTKYKNLEKNNTLSIIVNDPSIHSYISMTGKAEFVESFGEITKNLIDKYMPSNTDEGMKMLNEPGRVLVKLVPQKVLKN